MRKILVFSTLFLLVATSVIVVSGQSNKVNLSFEKARVFSAAAGRSLTRPSEAAPRSVIAGFLRSRGHQEQTINSLLPVSEIRVERRALTHVRMEQELYGLKVYGAYVKATLNGRGELVHLIESLATPSPGGLRPALIGPREALEASLNLHYPSLNLSAVEDRSFDNTVTFSNDGFFYRDPMVTRVAVRMEDGSIEEGFLVETWSGKQNLLHHTLVGRDGRILSVELRTNTDSYNIFPDHPGNSTQTVTAGPGAGNAQSPQGWLFASGQTTVNISGNNAHAYLDTDANNAPDPGGSSVTSGNFLTAANLSQDPSTATNQAVAVQNLFYLNNVVHDKLYRHGFIEAAGNFQENNFAQGGAGNDSVQAEAQDGGGTNNANFSTPADGSKPRMQMFLWTQSTPRRDGDVDSDIVWHEYGHGLTWRMIGSMSGPMSGAIGEGASDVLSILINNNDVVGEYSFNNPLGIRRNPYTNYPRTYGNFSGTSVHNDGEIYAATIWRLWEYFQANSISQDTLFDYLVGGMNFTPAGPAMEDMRDGILAAANGSGHECLIWQAFADFGIGVGAKATIRGNRVTITESFQVPTQCTGGPNPGPPMHVGDLDGSGSLGSQGKWNATVTITVHDQNHAPVSNATVDGSWSAGATGTGSCVTNGSGQCSVTKSNIKNNTGSVTFSVSGVTHAVNSYTAGANHDPDGDSNGTSITVIKP